jgi:hypothetical protein
METIYSADEILADQKLRNSLKQSGYNELVNSAFKQAAQTNKIQMENRFVKKPCRRKRKRWRGL